MKIAFGYPLCPEHTIFYMKWAAERLGYDTCWAIGEEVNKGFDMSFIMQWTKVNPMVFGRPTAYWYTDIGTVVHVDTASYNELTPLAMMEKCTYTFTGIKHDIPFVGGFVKETEFLSFACDPKIHKPTLEAEYDISFVGSLATPRSVKGLLVGDWGDAEFPWYRQYLLKKLEDNGITTHIWGSPPRDKKIVFNEMTDFYSLGKTIFNYSVRGGLNMRVYEALAMNRLLFTNRQTYPKWSEPDIFFQDGKHLIVFNDEYDLIEKVKYYLENKRERLQIAQNGMEEVLKNHTYDHRMKRVIEVLEELK